MKYPHLAPLMESSIVKETPRGTRRFFPIGKIRKGKWLHKAYHIIYGKYPSDWEVMMAVLHQSLDKYVERFDGKLWVRTIVV